METIIGIDLGTTFSAVATIDASGRPVILKNSQGDSLTPSVIWFGGDKPVVGAEAKQMQEVGEHDIASFYKRSMGDPNFTLFFRGQPFSAEDLSAIALQKLKADAETALGKPVRKAVITVPAYFNDPQRNATIRAGAAADLEVIRIINEPTAAAIAFGLSNQVVGQTILVYDLGGGTFDVTVIKIDTEVIEVLGTDGDHELGGKNWDDRIITYMAQKFEEEFSLDPLADSIAFNDLIIKAENAKKQLSVRNSTTFTLTYAGEKGKYILDIQIFETITADLLERTQLLTEKLLEDIQLDWATIDGVLLVGGSTRMPMVSRWITKMSGKTPLRGVNVDESVAIGAAIQANLDANGSASPGLMAIGGNRKIVDVMSHSLGMVAENETRSHYINSILIPKNKSIPSKQTKPYQIRTSPNKPNSTDVYMLQGENQNPLECNIIGKYIFSHIEHQTGGLAILDITYAYDQNGIIKVSGQQRNTGKELMCTVEPVPADISWLGLPPKQEASTLAHLSVLLAIDLSGSMSGNPLYKAKEAANAFIQKLDLANTSIGLVQFADEIKMTQPLCQSAKLLEKGIASWNIGDVGYGNSTQPFTWARKILSEREAPKFLVVLTDGVWSNQPNAIKEAGVCKEKGIEIIAVGFGGADQKFLQRVATSDENAMLTNLNNLTASFSKIAQVLTESGGDTSGTKRTGIFTNFK